MAKIVDYYELKFEHQLVQIVPFQTFMPRVLHIHPELSSCSRVARIKTCTPYVDTYNAKAVGSHRRKYTALGMKSPCRYSRPRHIDSSNGV